VAFRLPCLLPSWSSERMSINGPQGTIFCCVAQYSNFGLGDAAR
jgi:hypothetical protein